MRILRVYADTSVFGGAFDEEFREASRDFFQQVREGRFILVTSALVREEIEEAPERVRDLFDEIAGTTERTVVTDDAVRLRAGYIEAGVVGERQRADALHIALATVSGCSVIVRSRAETIASWLTIPSPLAGLVAGPMAMGRRFLCSRTAP